MANQTQIKIDRTQLDRLMKNFKRAPEATANMLSRAIDAAEAVMAKNTIKHDPVPYQHGFLLSSFRFQKLSRFRAIWYPTAHYAAYVDQGTGPYTINNAFGRGISVRHPGLKGKFYMAKIEKKARAEVGEKFREAADKLEAELARK